MEFHYVIKYDTETKKWSSEDETKYLDGNVWSGTNVEGEPYWYWPDDGFEYLMDQRCHTMIDTLLSIWPEVDDTDDY